MNYYGLQYFIRAGSDSSEQTERLTVKILDLEDAIEIGTEELDPELNSLSVYIHNKEDFYFEDLNVKFSSKFFEIEKDFNLEPNQRIEFMVDLNKEDFKQLTAGFYTLEAELSIKDITAKIEGIIDFVEKMFF